MVLPDERMGRSVGRRRQSAQSLERERLGVSRMLKATWMLQQREDAGVPLRQERKTVQSRVWG